MNCTQTLILYVAWTWYFLLHPCGDGQLIECRKGIGNMSYLRA